MFTTTTTTYPNGTQLVSSALTAAQIQAQLQQLTLAMVGLPVTPNSNKVRSVWQLEGAPFQQTTEDVCYLRCSPEDIPYSKLREKVGGYDPDSGDFTMQWNYTRGWEIFWTWYGPNSMDNARMLKSALYREYFTDQLSNLNLFPESELREIVRLPELIKGQWFERADLSCCMYEFVTETIIEQTVESVEVLVEDTQGVTADITIS